MEVELNVMNEKKVWNIVQRPNDVNIVGCKWVFFKKITNTEEPKFKARLVAQGFKSVMGFDYQDTSSPVLQRKTMRILIAIAACKNWSIEQLDVTSAFLKSPISHDIFLY